MFKKITLLSAAALMVMGTVQGAEKSQVRMDKFYGKITAVNIQSKSITAFNKKKKAEASFKLSGDTRVVLKKADQNLDALEVGQSVIVYYTGDETNPVARRITIRGKPQKRT